MNECLSCCKPIPPDSGFQYYTNHSHVLLYPLCSLCYSQAKKYLACRCSTDWFNCPVHGSKKTLMEFCIGCKKAKPLLEFAQSPVSKTCKECSAPGPGMKINCSQSDCVYTLQGVTVSTFADYANETTVEEWVGVCPVHGPAKYKETKKTWAEQTWAESLGSLAVMPKDLSAPKFHVADPPLTWDNPKSNPMEDFKKAKNLLEQSGILVSKSAELYGQQAKKAAKLMQQFADTDQGHFVGSVSHEGKRADCEIVCCVYARNHPF